MKTLQSLFTHTIKSKNHTKSANYLKTVFQTLLGHQSLTASIPLNISKELDDRGIHQFVDATIPHLVESHSSELFINVRRISVANQGTTLSYIPYFHRKVFFQLLTKLLGHDQLLKHSQGHNYIKFIMDMSGFPLKKLFFHQEEEPTNFVFCVDASNKFDMGSKLVKTLENEKRYCDRTSVFRSHEGRTLIAKQDTDLDHLVNIELNGYFGPLSKEGALIIPCTTFGGDPSFTYTPKKPSQGKGKSKSKETVYYNALHLKPSKTDPCTYLSISIINAPLSQDIQLRLLEHASEVCSFQFVQPPSEKIYPTTL